MTFQTLLNPTIGGLTAGGSFALAALGIVLVYRVTGVLNFANGAMGMFCTFMAWQAAYGWHWPAVFATLFGLAFSVVLGFFLQNGIFRFLSGQTQLVKAVVTVGLLLAFQAAASLIWGNTQYHLAINVVDPSASFPVFNINVGYNQLLVMVTALALAGGIAAFLRYTPFGIAMRAVSDDPVAARLWGVPVDLVGSASWMAGTLVAAISGILLTPFLNFDTVSLTVLELDALAAALIGGLVSLPLTVIGGFALGLLESYPGIWIKAPGFPKLVALAVILLVLIARQATLQERRA